MRGAGGLHEPQSGTGLEPDGRQRRQPVDYRHAHQEERESGESSQSQWRREGRIVLSVPAPTGNAVEDAIYAGWLYAAVSTPTGGFDGLFMTKDFGQNWVQVNIATIPPAANFNQAIPTNDVTQPNYAITLLSQGNLYLTLSADPTNPNIVYLGSFGNTVNDVAGTYNAQAAIQG